jgi:hypothetical protein
MDAALTSAVESNTLSKSSAYSASCIEGIDVPTRVCCLEFAVIIYTFSNVSGMRGAFLFASFHRPRSLHFARTRMSHTSHKPHTPPPVQPLNPFQQSRDSPTDVSAAHSAPFVTQQTHSLHPHHNLSNAPPSHQQPPSHIQTHLRVCLV